MLEVEQRTEFDCLQACLASIFECAYEETPEIFDPLTGKQMKKGNWLHQLRWWAEGRGHMVDVFFLDGLEAPEWGGKRFGPRKHWMAGVISPLGPPGHGIVMLGDEIAYNPDPFPTDPVHLGFRNGYVFSRA